MIDINTIQSKKRVTKRDIKLLQKRIEDKKIKDLTISEKTLTKEEAVKHHKTMQNILKYRWYNPFSLYSQHAVKEEPKRIRLHGYKVKRKIDLSALFKVEAEPIYVFESQTGKTFKYVKKGNKIVIL